MKIGEIVSICSHVFSRKNILSSIKGHKMTGNNPNLDLVNINAYIKFGEILSIRSQNIERMKF